MLLTNLDAIWTEGYNRIMNDDKARQEQEYWVMQAAEELRKIPKEELFKRQFLYVPNDIYLMHYFGSEIADYKYGVYRNEQCSLYKRLIYPIRGFNNEVAGIGGWANDSQWKYVYSPDTCWDKSRHLYIQSDEFKQALTDGYIILVDGIFDSINLNKSGFHSASLMGSYLSKWHRYYLKMFKYVIVIPDNDNAGVLLVKALRKFRQDTIVLKQGKTKDIDEFIIMYSVDNLTEMLQNLDTLQILHDIII